METTPDLPVHSEKVSPRRFATGIERLPIVFVNAYMVGEPGGPWVLVDTGIPGFAGRIRRAAEARYGGRPPEAIILTHGHFDHASSARELADLWDVKVYAHRLEIPYLDGRSDYPPHDPTVGGALGLMSRTFPHRGIDLGARLRLLPINGDVPGLPGWRWLPTPGHTAGHISLFRDADGVLLAGDALATLDQDSPVAMVTQRRKLSVPPAPFTTDWQAAHASVWRLAGLRPSATGRPCPAPIAEGRSPARRQTLAWAACRWRAPMSPSSCGGSRRPSRCPGGDATRRHRRRRMRTGWWRCRRSPAICCRSRPWRRVSR